MKTLDILDKLKVVLLRSSLFAMHAFKNKNYDVWQKRNQGPCTSADIRINELLKKDLNYILPDIGWLSEESKNNKKRLQLDNLWIVDPIDGTNDFINGSPEFSISVGLILHNLPITGGIALPATNEIIIGDVRIGLEHYKYDGPDDLDIAKDIENISLEDFHEKIMSRFSFKQKDIIEKTARNLGEAKILISRTESKKNKLSQLENDFNCIHSSSIARKLALVATGRADAAISLCPKHEWDIAGGVPIIISRSKYNIIELKKFNEHHFNSKKTLSYGLFAGPSHLQEEFQQYMKKNKIKVFKKW